MSLDELYINLTTWMKNLSIERNKLCGGPVEFKSAFLDQLIDCRSALCQVLAVETVDRRKEVLQTIVESVTSQIVILEKLVSQASETKNSSIAMSMTPGSGPISSGISSMASDDNPADEDPFLATIQKNQQTCSFNDIAGLDYAKQTLNESLLLPAKFPTLFQGCRAPWKSLLLYGPPGTGKTELAKAVSGEADAVFFSVSSSDLISSYVGESEKLVKRLFTSARAQEKQSVIFIDEIDSVCRERSSREEEYTRRVKNELLKQIEGVGTNNDNLFLLCATNCPWELDTAFLRRFERRLYIPLPDPKTRSRLMRMFLKDTDHNITDDGWEMLERETEGYSGSDLRCVVNDAGLIAVRELSSATHWIVQNAKWKPCTPSTPGAIKLPIQQLKPSQICVRGVTTDDLMTALNRTPPSVSTQDVFRHETWSKPRTKNCLSEF